MTTSNDPLQTLLEASAGLDLFAQSGRYAQVAKAHTTLPNGQEIAYLKRRVLPMSIDSLSQTALTTNEGERLDHIAYKYLSDSELFWKIADTNTAMNPLDLTQEPGSSLKIDPYA